MAVVVLLVSCSAVIAHEAFLVDVSGRCCGCGHAHMSIERFPLFRCHVLWIVE